METFALFFRFSGFPRTALLFFTFHISSLALIGQNTNDYLAYYRNVQSAEKHYALKQYDSAYTDFSKAFDLVDFYHAYDISVFIKVCRKVGQRQRIKELKRIDKFQKKNIDVEYKRIIDSLHSHDRRVRSKRHYNARNYLWKAKFDTSFVVDSGTLVKSERLMNEWLRVDSMNIQTLLSLINEKGFPSQKRVGAYSNISAYLLLLHFDRDTCNYILNDILWAALINGEILPNLYAYIVDRHLDNCGKSQLYFTIPPRQPGDLPEKLQKEVNERRLEIGLKPLEDRKIIYKKGVTIVRE